MRVDQDAVDSGRGDPESARQLHRPLPQAQPQIDAAPSGLLTRLVRGATRPGRPVLPGFAVSLAVGPTLDGRPGDLESGGDLADRPTVVNNHARDDQAMPWGERRVGVGHD